MSTIERAILVINLSNSRSAKCPAMIDVRVQLVVVLAFIIVTLSIPIDDPASLLWLFSFPIIMSEALGIGYLNLLRRSLWILPIVVVIGIFNPFIDKQAVWQIGPWVVDRGWLTFMSLILRGLLTFQGLLILISGYGFYDICRVLQCFGCPKVLVTQLLMLYRYIGVLLNEALSMHRARLSRGYGRQHYPLRMWGAFIGQLLIRSMHRAHRINNAMLSRGFTGTYHFAPFAYKPQFKDYAYLCVWLAVFAIIRFVNLTALTAHLIR